MKSWKEKITLENKIEKYIKIAYKDWEYIRFYNLMQLLEKINPTNEILIKYIDKIDDGKKDKYIKKWRWWFNFIDIIRSPKFYISIFIRYMFWYTK